VARTRGTETIGDMVRSLGLVLIVVAFIGGLVALAGARPTPIREVDDQAALEQARADAPFTVLGPEGLPEEWTATRVTYELGDSRESGVWRMNYLSPQGTYVGLVQSTGEPNRVIRQELPGFEPDGESTVAGQAWTRMVEVGVGDPDRALVLETDDTVVVLLTSGSYSELEDFASRLR
jgi:hypothetical protein